MIKLKDKDIQFLESKLTPAERQQDKMTKVERSRMVTNALQNDAGIPNFTNAQINKEILSNSDYKRVGKCKNCNGKCCNFITYEPNWRSDGPSFYTSLHGEYVLDRWWRVPYLMVNAPCNACTEDGKCKLYQINDMPGACGQWPVSPTDQVYRYLIQTGNPCGLKLVSKESGKPVNLSKLPHGKKAHRKYDWKIRRWTDKEFLKLKGKFRLRLRDGTLVE